MLRLAKRWHARLIFGGRKRNRLFNFLNEAVQLALHKDRERQEQIAKRQSRGGCRGLDFCSFLPVYALSHTSSANSLNQVEIAGNSNGDAAAQAHLPSVSEVPSAIGNEEEEDDEDACGEEISERCPGEDKEMMDSLEEEKKITDEENYLNLVDECSRLPPIMTTGRDEYDDDNEDGQNTATTGYEVYQDALSNPALSDNSKNPVESETGSPRASISNYESPAGALATAQHRESSVAESEEDGEFDDGRIEGDLIDEIAKESFEGDENKKEKDDRGHLLPISFYPPSPAFIGLNEPPEDSPTPPTRVEMGRNLLRRRSAVFTKHLKSFFSTRKVKGKIKD
jgi:hypothetical protein